MFAYDYPILGAFWTILWFFLFVAWLIILFKVIFDIFRSHDMGGCRQGRVGAVRDHHPVARRARLPDRSRPGDG